MTKEKPSPPTTAPGWAMNRAPIVHAGADPGAFPQKAVRADAGLGPRPLQCGPIRVPAPIRAPAPMTAKGPTLTPSSSRAVSSITAVG